MSIWKKLRKRSGRETRVVELVKKIKKLLQRIRARAARRGRETKHFSDRQQVIQKRAQRLQNMQRQYAYKYKDLPRLLEELPAELENPNPDVDKIKLCEFLLTQESVDRKLILNEARKGFRLMRKIGKPAREKIDMETIRTITKTSERTRGQVLNKIQHWKNAHGIK